MNCYNCGAATERLTSLGASCDTCVTERRSRGGRARLFDVRVVGITMIRADTREQAEQLVKWQGKLALAEKKTDVVWIR